MLKRHSRKGTRAHSELLLSLHLQSNPDALCLVRATMQQATEILRFQDADSRAIVRSVDEALANVIRHAYKGRAGLPIEVTCGRLCAGKDSAKANGLEIVLKDSGASGDPRRFKGRSLEDVRPGGLGLHFMKESMDEIEFSRKDGKNVLRMVKYLAPPDGEEKREGE